MSDADGRFRSSSTARSTTIRSCARSSRRAATGSAPRPTPRSFSRPIATWGTDCLSRLNGMFAFALYDRRGRDACCSRGIRRARSRCSTDATPARPRLRLRAEGAARRPGVSPRAGHRTRSTTTLPSATCPASVASSPASTSCRRDTRCTFDVELGTTRTWAYWALPAFRARHRLRRGTARRARAAARRFGPAAAHRRRAGRASC